MTKQFMVAALSLTLLLLRGIPAATAEGECQICAGYPNATMLGTTIPSTASDLLLHFGGTSSDQNKTCAELQTYAREDLSLRADSPTCLRVQNLLLQSCCDGLPPLYQCQTAIHNKLFSASNGLEKYNTAVAPFRKTSVDIDVGISIQVFEMSISNHGINGGAIEVAVKIHLEWIDERLQWDPSQRGCTEIFVSASDDPDRSAIWVPNRGSSIENKLLSSRATVLSDGSVSWDREIMVEAPCETVAGVSKVCKVKYGSAIEELWRNNGINYIVGGAEDGKEVGSHSVFSEDLLPIAGYKLNEGLAHFSTSIENDELSLELYLEPLSSNCSMCGDADGFTLNTDLVPTSFNVGNGPWKYLVPGQEGYSCGQIDTFLSTLPIYGNGSELCYAGLIYFMAACCKGFSYNECESSLHDEKTKSIGNTVTAPDPPLGYDDLWVTVNLDVLHVLDIDIRANTLELLVSFELYWLDERLGWDPFMSGCTAASYRASLDQEQTDIWVPEIDLLNQVEGTQGLPSAQATVFPNGAVWWKRTGVLKAASDLQGIGMFPFDKPSGNLDFGSARDPLAHHVFYVKGGAEFSDRIINKTAIYQEYQMDYNLTTVSVESETISGYTSQIIRFQFYFERAFSYYMWMFIVLYILFTYMSFGMFFLDQQVGERLGYGTSILFVIVAQDITLSGYTPVTHKLLWIYKFSLGSKCFVIFSIVESLIILYLYFRKDLDGDGIDDESDAVYGAAATESLIDGDPIEENIEMPRELSGSKADQGGNRHCSRCAAECCNRTSFCLWVDKHILRYRPNPNDSIMRQKVMRLRLVDRSMALLFLLAYTCFIIVMFSVALS